MDIPEDFLLIFRSCLFSRILSVEDRLDDLLVSKVDGPEVRSDLGK